MIKVFRNDTLAEIWIGDKSERESEKIGEFHTDYIPHVIAALKRFEQSEGRTKNEN